MHILGVAIKLPVALATLLSDLEHGFLPLPEHIAVLAVYDTVIHTSHPSVVVAGVSERVDGWRRVAKSGSYETRENKYGRPRRP